MAAILGILVFYPVLQTLLLTVAVSIGFALHCRIPDLAIGTGVLAGVLSSIACARLLVQFMRAKHMGMFEQLLADLEDEDQDEESPELCIAVPPSVKRTRQSRKH